MRERKSTEVSWIGEIPLDWELKKIKRVFKTTNGYGFPEKLQGEKNGDIPFLKVSDFPKNSDFILSSSNYVSLDILNQKNWKTTEPMSIITAKIGEAMKKNHRKINVEPCLIDNNMMALTVKEGLLKYLFYVSKVIDFSWFANPGAIPSLNHRHFRESYIMSPPIVEQQKIANFLDQKTSEIDTLISHKEKLIVLLEEKRQAIITETVTKGLDSDVKMKDSGVEWIGEIPEHWELKRLKYIYKGDGNGIKIGPFGSSLKLDEMTDTGIKVYGQENLIKQDFHIGKKYISEDKFNQLHSYKVKSGDILFSMMGTLGKCEVVPDDVEVGIMDSHLLRVSPDRKVVIPEYIPLIIRDSMLSEVQLKLFSKGSIMSGINSTIIKNLIIVLPPYKEQNDILNYLNDCKNEYSSIISDLKQAIHKLKEYRQALIYEAVTGKIDVQEMAQETEQEEVLFS